MAQKTLLVTAGEDIILRNVFATDFWPVFSDKAQQFGWKIHIVTAPATAKKIEAITAGRAIIHVYTRDAPSRTESLVMSLARSAIRSHTNLWSKMRSHARGDSTSFATYAKRLLTYCLGTSSVFKRMLRAWILRLPSETAAQKIFTEIRPDIFIPLSLTNFDFDVPLAREARKRELHIIGMVRSWDNLSSHGLLRVVPDVFVFQNNFLKQMAETYQDIYEPKTPMHIVGLPHYDRYFRAGSDVLSRGKLFDMFGLDPQKKLVVYGAMGEFLFTTEYLMPEILDRAIEKSGLAEEVQVLFRAHPKFIPREGYASTKNVKIHIPRSYAASEGGSSNENILFSILRHADLIVSGASTFALDGIVLGKPVVCIGFDGRQVPYWESMGRFFDTYTHFEAFIETSKVPIVRSEDALCEFLRTRHWDTNARLDYRDKVLDRFVGSHDGSAGVHLAEKILLEANRLSS